MDHAVCTYRADDVKPEMLPDFKIVASADSRNEFLTAITAVEPDVAIIGLDDEGTLDTAVEALEAKPNTIIVGVTANTDVAHIIAAQRAGCTQIVMRPIDANDLAMALRKAIGNQEKSLERSTVLSVLGATGGVGATTIACHLAMELKDLFDQPAAVFDVDLEFGGVSRAFDVVPSYTIADLASAGAVDRFLLEKAATKTRSGVDVFARPIEFDNAHGISDSDIRTMIRGAKQAYPFVVLDLPRHLSPITGVGIEESDKLLVAIQLTVPNIDNAKRLTQALVSEGVPQKRIVYAVNRFRKNIHSCTLEMAESELGGPILAIIPNDYPAVNQSTDSGSPLSARHPVRACIRDLATQLVGKPEDKKPKGWFGKLGRSRRTANSPD